VPGVNLPKDFDPKAFKQKTRKFAHAIPTRDTCDLTDPMEMFLWMMVALPGVNGGQQVMPSSYNMLVSQHYYECGAMLACPACGHEKTPEKVYVPPSAHDPHWLTSPGRWVAPGKEPADEENAIDKSLAALPSHQKAALLQRLLKLRESGEL